MARTEPSYVELWDLTNDSYREKIGHLLVLLAFDPDGALVDRLWKVVKEYEGGARGA